MKINKKFCKICKSIKNIVLETNKFLFNLYVVLLFYLFISNLDINIVKLIYNSIYSLQNPTKRATEILLTVEIFKFNQKEIGGENRPESG